eukprot:CAMPEP_0194378362 /NCGR_PEP_ID=MMETSP0174-20130528/34742_1 /TAXON_ID=216777 /ORGANISM="Proboscia alata, Strain PI-D3" /LENGTH=291 /DNA_ID=CAMNT_0039160291 /DNA_START=60 /DNA_END=935 /DNA_ORIENTATION=+
MSSLNYLNYLNLSGYILNCAITFFAAPIFQFPDNAELSEKYQTLVTPAGWAFSIWGIIFVSQGIFAIFQMLPKYRDIPIVQHGVKYWYFVTCVVQSAWTFAFGYEYIILSTIFMLSILTSLLFILYFQDKNVDSSDGTSLLEFWIFRFPFSIHAGWIVAASAVNINVVPVSRDASALTQIGVATFGFVWVVIFAVSSTFVGKSPEFAIPGVGSWATLAIALELNDPSDLILNTFDESVIRSFKIASFSLSGFLFVWCIGFGIYQFVRGQCIVGGSKRTIESDGLRGGYHIS